MPQAQLNQSNLKTNPSLKNCQILSIVLNVWQAPTQKRNNENSQKQKRLSLSLNGKTH
jgi:hypothetical protein